MAHENKKLGMTMLCAMVAGLAAIGCGSDPGDQNQTGSTVTIDNQSKVEGLLDGHGMVMEGDDIPSHPNGYSQDVNFAQATQCYNRVDMTLGGSIFNVDSKLGLLQNAPNKGDVGQCDRTTVTTEQAFKTTTYVMENFQGDAECFDITLTYTGFGQEGRGSLTDGRSVMKLELFFKDQATGHRCADGGVGSGTITLNGNAFTGNAVQTYRIQ